MKTTEAIMEDKADELLAILDKDIQHIQKSLLRLNKIRNLVITRDDAALGELLQNIRTEADSYIAIESQRRSIRISLANVIGCSVEQMTLSSLETMLPEEKKAQVEDRKTKLRELIVELRKEHLRTTLFVSDCARFTRQLLKSLFDLGGKEMVFYKPGGITRSRTNTNLVNMRL